MKKVLPIAFLLTVSLFSCGKEDLVKEQEDDRQENRIDIKGEWSISQLKVDGQYTGNIDTCLKVSIFKFVGESEYAKSDKCTGEDFSGTYSITGNTITIPVGNTKIVYNVIDIDDHVGEFIRLNSDGSTQEFLAVRK